MNATMQTLLALPAPELDSIVRDGSVRRCGPSLVPSWWEESPDTRLQALVAATPAARPPRVIECQTAAWVWCGGPAPTIVEACVIPPGGGSHTPRVSNLMLRQRSISRGCETMDSVVAGAGTVTTPARTAADLALAPDGPDAVAWLATLSRILDDDDWTSAAAVLARQPGAQRRSRAARRLDDARMLD